MKIKYILIVTFTALSAIFFLQGLWLNNTYRLVEDDFNKNTSKLLFQSLEKEAVSRLEDLERRGEVKGKVIKGYRLENDQNTNNRALQDFLYNEDYPLSLEKVDSILKEEIKKHYQKLDYSLLITDLLENQTTYISNKQEKFNEGFAYKVKSS